MAFNRLTAFEGDLYQFLLGLRPFLSLDILSVTFDCVITTFNHNILYTTGVTSAKKTVSTWDRRTTADGATHAGVWSSEAHEGST